MEPYNPFGRPLPTHACSRSPNWPLPGPSGQYDDFDDISLMPLRPASFDSFYQSPNGSRVNVRDDSSSTRQLLATRLESGTSAGLRFQSPPRSPSPQSTPSSEPLSTRDQAFGKREAYITVFVGAACGTVTGIFWGSMLGSLWGSQSEAESLRPAAPAGLGLGLVVGSIVAAVKLRRTRRPVVISAA